MVIRIFRVKINAEFREEFEPQFSSVSIDAVRGQDGFISVSIGKPSKWSPDEYTMISKWENTESLEKFVGDAWNEAHIPEGMEKFVNECWVHHYHEFGHA